MNKILKLILLIFVVLNIVVWGAVIIKKNGAGHSDHDCDDHKNPWVSVESPEPPDPYRDLKIKAVTLPEFNVQSNCGADLDSAQLDGNLNVLVFFSFKDCSSCLFEAEYWGLTDITLGQGVKFFGVVDSAQGTMLKEFQQEYTLSFPLICDPGERLKSTILGLKPIQELGLITPFKVFISNGRIIHIEGPRKYREQHEAFPDRVAEVLHAL